MKRKLFSLLLLVALATAACGSNGTDPITDNRNQLATNSFELTKNAQDIATIQAQLMDNAAEIATTEAE